MIAFALVTPLGFVTAILLAMPLDGTLGKSTTESEGAWSTEAQAASAVDFASRLEKIVAVVEERFFRDPLELPNYRAAREAAREAALECTDHREFSALVNRYLQSLQASHTYYLTRHDWEYYHLAAVFESLPEIQSLFQQQPIAYPSIGVILQRRDREWIVADILPGGPAAKTELRIGDVLLTVNDQPYEPVTIWWPLVDQNARLVVRRAAEKLPIEIKPVRVHPGDELLGALQASISVVAREGSQIGYAHFYSYAGRKYHEALEQAIQSGPLVDAEALVIDLRYGLGGADPNYLNLFNQQIPLLESIDREGQASTYATVWRKPLVLLINETSRSGKEVLAWGAKRHGQATLVGTKTAGAVVAGSPIVIDGEDLLYLAVRDVRVDGQRLEGTGVAPDVEVGMDLSTCRGVDVQKEAALTEAVKLVRKAR